jgi:metal-responsive CopG/Arc/MetJ family transcriptional regulator
VRIGKTVTKLDWFNLAIPKALAQRIQRIFQPLGYKSVSDFVAKAVQEWLPREENRFEEVEENVRSWKEEQKDLSA